MARNSIQLTIVALRRVLEVGASCRPQMVAFPRLAVIRGSQGYLSDFKDPHHNLAFQKVSQRVR